MKRNENKVLCIDEYKRGVERLESFPRVVYIETTNTCNLACPMCPITMGIEKFIGKSKFFAWELVEKMKPMLELADRCVMSGGGEPFLHPRFIDMIRLVKSAGSEIIFNTNATLMDEKASKSIIEYQADTLSFSVDGANPEVYKKIRVGAELENVEKNIRRLVELKKKAGSDKPFLNLQMTLIRENIEEIIPVVELAADWGIRHVVVEPLTPVFSEDAGYAKYFSEHMVHVGDALPRIRIAKNRAEELGVIFSSHYLVLGGDETAPSADGHRCPQPWINFGVRADGRVFPCCGTSETMGDIFEADPMDVWNGERYAYYRSAFAAGKPPDGCESCLSEGRALFFNADLVEEDGVQP